MKNRVILLEAVIGALLGAGVTAAIFALVFPFGERLSLSEFNLDLVLQTTGLCVLSTLGVSLGRRAQMRKGRLPSMPPFAWLPRPLLMRITVITGSALLLFAFPACWIVALVFPDGFGWTSALTLKAVYGAALGAATGALAVRAVMGEAEQFG